MRAVDKGKSPKTYLRYQDARNDLIERIGRYCSYCEMPVTNMIEVEHVVPQSQNGQKFDWDNFLLSCKYCNTNKKDKNSSRNEHLFPDQDDTSIAFQYNKYQIVPKANLTPSLTELAQKTINLCGLNKYPNNSNNILSKSDTRWRSRNEVWNIAELSIDNYKKYPHDSMLKQIILTAIGNGHYSIWIEVFNQYPEFKQVLDKELKGTYSTKYDNEGRVIQRQGGKL